MPVKYNPRNKPLVMIYKLTFTSDEVDNFKLVFEADSEATFLDLHNAILAAAGYPDDQMTSFFTCNEEWEREQEVTLIEMGGSYEYDNMIMNETHLSELLYEPKQRLIYIFDPMFDRNFFGSLTSMKPGTKDGVECIEKKGKAPKQLQTDAGFDAAQASKANKGEDFMDEDFYGDSQYDADELDMEGFQDLSFEDGSMF